MFHCIVDAHCKVLREQVHAGDTRPSACFVSPVLYIPGWQLPERTVLQASSFARTKSGNQMCLLHIPCLAVTRAGA